jgi:predicted KAP-like P-loop ATPase
MTEEQSAAPPLGSDRPVIDPAQDAFGYAPFARRLARAVSETPSPEGLVMAIHGPWGCGKSTLLNFVKHEIAALPEEHRPIVIDFNPWWFEGQQNLAAQFLAQFSARLPRESQALREIGDVIAEYADAVGSVVAASTGIPLVRNLSFVLKLLKRKAKDVPTLKAEISKALRESGRRFLFVLDDIDRLTPDEVREIFKVVKALADFPNVVYILAFDRKTVVEALQAAHKIDGEAYLEKIVQAPFSLPAIDRARLRARLQEELGRLIDRFKGPVIDRTYWANVYMDGLDPYITKPRDIVRLMNALTVTYPAVAGEVNAVDFIAMEFLRLFEPAVYGIVRDHPDLFTGYSNDRHGGRRDAGKEFHEAWLSQVSQERREQVQALMKRVFPRLQSVWGNMGYSASHESQWRNALRVCSPEIFDVYFQFGVADDVLSRREMNHLLTAAGDGQKEVTDILAAAATVKRPNGTSKARDYLDRIRDCEEEITPQMADVLVTVLSDIGDTLLAPEDEQAQGMGSLPNRWRLMGVINYLLNRAEPAPRLELIKNLVAVGHSIALAADAIETVDELRAKPENAPGWALAEVGDELLSELKRTWVERLRSLSDSELLATPELDFDLHRWMRWGDPQEVIQRVRPLFESDELLPLMLEKHLRFGTRHVDGDRISNRIPILNPKTFEQLADIFAMESRVQAMLERQDLTENQRLAGDQYMWAMGRIRQGRDPGSLRDID